MYAAASTISPTHLMASGKETLDIENLERRHSHQNGPAQSSATTRPKTAASSTPSCIADTNVLPGGRRASLPWSSARPDTSAMQRSFTYSGSVELGQKLTRSQKRMLVSTWKHMCQNGVHNIMERIFQRLIQSRPKVKHVFYKAAFVQLFSRYGGSKGTTITNLHDHARILIKVFDDIICNLSHVEPTMNDIMELGGQHAFLRKSGLKAEIWEAFGEAAIEILLSQECIKANADAVRGWTVVVACVTDEMRHGFEQECRAGERK